MTQPEFREWPKTPRLFRDVVVTEKIDGTNSCVIVDEDGDVHAQSRNRVIALSADNFGFARWVYDNSAGLRDTLGVGYHYGEWWGSGIQRRYGLSGPDKRFSMFNVSRWADHDLSDIPGLGVVPVLYEGRFNTVIIDDVLARLRQHGSVASPGFMDPEGICVYHVASRQVFKTTLKDDAQPKSVAS